MTTTPVYDEVTKTHPYPVLSVDTAFHWDRPARVVSPAPRPGAKPINRRKRSKTK